MTCVDFLRWAKEQMSAVTGLEVRGIGAGGASLKCRQSAGYQDRDRRVKRGEGKRYQEILSTRR